ncbi:GNAT family N-acetyltransferase [Mammaliicoccus vitulinus]|uniref:GNAT family N-acetyltransferase n=1 Tax=Mammaliicoccus vitulinus TaxID=71237 RepID=UPI001AADA0FE|nr:GNAT family N-acetyltransferase [Mammaliicoccus vitulinus]MBO3077703.1 GNAT family N-acetyltransferase [Mammaliicoccus vitulinus]
MEWKSYENLNIPNEVTDSLKKQQGKYNLVERLIYFINEGKYDDYSVSVLYSDEKVVALLVHTPPYPIQIVRLTINDDITSLVVKELIHKYHIQFGIAGDKTSTIHIANNIYNTWQEKSREGVYVCHEVNKDFQTVQGETKVLSHEDYDLIKEWYRKSMIDMNLEDELKHMTDEQEEKLIQQWIEDEAGQFFIKDGVPVSFVKYAKVGRYFAHVGMVYTPRKYRKNGYAGRNVALITQRLLNDFEYTTLYTDLNNPTSNKIYKEIGYNQLAEFIKILSKSIN